MSNILFQEVSPSESGLNYIGLTDSAAWGDFNGDGYPDLWFSNHHYATLYLNQGNGTFTDITAEVVLKDFNHDVHGAAWADFDNDGDQDLIQLVGGGGGVGNSPQLSKQMYVNEGGKLEDRAAMLGIAYQNARGRTPLWLDFDRDGRLDLFVGADPRPDGTFPPTIFRQTGGAFEDVRSTIGFGLTNAPFALLSDLSGDGQVEAIFRSTPLTVYQMSSVPWEDVTAALNLQTAIYANDIAAADFNGDLLPDLYLTQSGIGLEVVQTGVNRIQANFGVAGQQRGFQFNTSGDLSFDLLRAPWGLSLNKIYIGATGFQPTTYQFTLSPDNPAVAGIFPHSPGINRGIYIGYDPNQQRWQFLLSSPAPNYQGIAAIVESESTISGLTAIGFNPNIAPLPDQLLMNVGGQFVDRSMEAGINQIPNAGVGVVTGDFDNDMDLDIYLLATGPAANRPNILYENQGKGTFSVVPDAGGAAGTALGLGNAVTTVDYNLDGFLDLFVTNGNWPPTIAQEGPLQLFRNQGNENHWLQIDLEGVVSNRDGIGAQVFLTAGGVTQLREQSGGTHHHAQNHQRIHFGLGGNTQVDQLVIKWPSGRVQRVGNIPGDQLVRVIEAGGNENDRIIGETSNDIIAGGKGKDVLKGEGGNDYLYGDGGSDRLIGGSGDDTLIGGTGKDKLYGGNGEDLLNGKKGDDILSGGNGNDIFVLGEGKGVDTITDFQDSQDLFQLTGNLTFGQLSIKQVNSDTQISVTSSSDLLATLLGIDASAIDAGDFI